MHVHVYQCMYLVLTFRVWQTALGGSCDSSWHSWHRWRQSLSSHMWGNNRGNRTLGTSRLPRAFSCCCRWRYLCTEGEEAFKTHGCTHSTIVDLSTSCTTCNLHGFPMHYTHIYKECTVLTSTWLWYTYRTFFQCTLKPSPIRTKYTDTSTF